MGRSMANRNLIPSNRVRHQIQAVGNPVSMEKIVLGRLAEGLVYSQATKMVSTTAGIDKAASPKGIETAIWAVAVAQAATIATMWRTGDMIVTVGGTQHRMTGVHLDGNQIAELIREWATPADEWIQVKGGAPTAKWWSLFAVELARHVQDEGVPGDKSNETVSSVVRAMQDRIVEAGVEKGPDASSIRSTIELLVERHLAGV